MRIIIPVLCGIVGWTSIVSAVPRADLAGRWLAPTTSVPAVCFSPRFAGSLRVEVRNQGPAASPASSGMVFEDRDGDGLFSAGDIAQGVFAVPTLATCERGIVDVALDVPLSFAGSPLRVALDSTAIVGEILETNNVVDGLDECRQRGPVSFNLIEKWRYEPADPARDCGTSLAYNAVLVAQASDDNSDGLIDEADNPDLVVTQLTPSLYNVIRILDGPTGALRATIDPAATDAIRPYCCSRTPAVTDLDGDGVVEVVLSGSRQLDGRDVLAAFRLDGSLLWSTAVDGVGVSDLIVTDLDGDGEPEVVNKAEVLDRQGNLRWLSPFSMTALERNGDNYPEVADLDLDGQREILASAVAYRADGSFLWQHRDPLSPSFVSPVLAPDYHAIARASGGVPNVFAISGDVPSNPSHVYALDGASGAVIWGPVTFPFDVRARPAVADVDGDGLGDIIMAFNNSAVGARGVVVAVSALGSVLWQRDIGRVLSYAAPSTFDFDGNGSAEVLVRSADEVFMLDGRTGAVLSSAPSYMNPLGAYPTVADLDHDGRAEVIVPMGYYVGPWNNCGVVVYSNPTWWGARGTWPDVDYHIGDATDAGCIPADEPLSWCDHDTWRGQRALAPRLADASVSLVRASLAPCPNVTLSGRVGSAGGKPLPAGTFVTFYDGDPGTGGSPLGIAATTRSLTAGQFEDVSVTVLNPAVGIAALYAEVTTSAVECDSSNLCGSIAVPACGTTSCVASAVAAPATACASDTALLDATGSGLIGCATPVEYRFRQGATVLRDWSPDATAIWLFPIAGGYEVEVRCPSDTSCAASASSTVALDPGVLPGDLLNTLRAVRMGADVRLTWGVDANARSYSIYRSEVKDAWAGPTVEDLVARLFAMPDVAFPPAQYFYRVAGANCAGVEGP